LKILDSALAQHALDVAGESVSTEGYALVVHGHKRFRAPGSRILRIFDALGVEADDASARGLTTSEITVPMRPWL
jgi:hypothetical protein